MDDLYVLARRVLLDAVEALGPHREAVTLVGAQAVYLRVGEADLAVAPYTTDGDLALDPQILDETPPLEDGLQQAGFFLKGPTSVGEWVAIRQTAEDPHAEITVDLLVPASMSGGTGRRAARLRGHNPKAARLVAGLEGVVVDFDLMQLEALEPTDSRSIRMRVAGPAALLVAKAHKIGGRISSARQNDKDALDVLRLLRGSSTEDLAARYQLLLADPRSRAAAEVAVGLLRAQFTQRGPGIQIAVRAVGLLADPEEIAASCQVLASELLNALEI